MYSLNYKESLFKRIFIYKYKNGFLHNKLTDSHSNRTNEVGQLSFGERRGLKALGMENQILKEPGDCPMILTVDGFLQPQPSGISQEALPPAPFDEDAFKAHEELRGKSVESFLRGPQMRKASPHPPLPYRISHSWWPASEPFWLRRWGGSRRTSRWPPANRYGGR